MEFALLDDTPAEPLRMPAEMTGTTSRDVTEYGWPGRCPDPHQRVQLRIDQDTCVDFNWGPFWAFGSAAYWISQYLVRFGQAPLPDQAFGSNLLEETAACMLGGYGVSAEIGVAAYRAIRDAGLLRPGKVTPAAAFEAVLRAPLQTQVKPGSPNVSGPNRHVRYRFAHQRAARLELATRKFAEATYTPSCPVSLRDWLLSIPGIGHKTASWIVRNHTASNEVAIIDIHLQRAGVTAGFFSSNWTLPRDYQKFEKAFLMYCAIGVVPPSGLDALIWEEQRVVTTHCPLGSLSRRLPRPELLEQLEGFITPLS